MGKRELDLEKLILVGFGGHAKSVVDSIKRQNTYKIIGYSDIAKRDTEYKYLGTDDVLQKYYENGVKNVFICMGYLGGNDPRKQLYSKLKKIGYHFPVIIDPTAVIAPNVQIGEGSFIGKRAIINAFAKVSQMTIINSGAIIEHECKIDMFSHISIGAVLGGQVVIEDSVFVGANATVIQNITIGSNSIVGAGAVVTKDIPHSSVAVGNPVKVIQQNRV